MNENFSLIGLLNTNPSVAADCDLSNGQLSILDTTVTVGSLPWGGSVNWVDVVRNEVLASSAGAYLVQEFNTAAVTPTINTAYTVTITPDPESGLNAQTFMYRTGTVAPAIATLITSIAAEITASSQGTYLASNVANDLRVNIKAFCIFTNTILILIRLNGKTCILFIVSYNSNSKISRVICIVFFELHNIPLINLFAVLVFESGVLHDN